MRPPYNQADVDRAYANAAFIPAADGYPARWEMDAEAFRANMGARATLGVAYGPGARQRFDLFRPEGGCRGLLVFLHGGYWKAFGRESWSHLAAGALARHWACAMPSYTLAPEVRIGAMVVEAGQAVDTASAMVPGLPVVVTGHSAGGHLAARLGCVAAPVGSKLARVVPISPLAELEPLRDTEMNSVLRLDMAEVAAESPARLKRGTDAHVWVGGAERPAFLWQARVLAEEWACPWTVAEGRHHFNVVEDLSDPESGLIEACIGGI